MNDSIKHIAISGLAKMAGHVRSPGISIARAHGLKKIAENDGGIIDNATSATKSWSHGIMTGLLNTPGVISGLVSGAGRSLYSGITGDGFGNGWSKGWDAGRSWGDSLGIGDYDIEHAKRRVATWQNHNMDDYMEGNNIDPESELSWGDRMALNGMGIANSAGEFLGETLAFDGAGKLLTTGVKTTGKVLPKVVGKFRKPPAAGGASAASEGAAASESAAAATGRAAGSGVIKLVEGPGGKLVPAGSGTAAGGTTGMMSTARTAINNMASSSVMQATKPWLGRAFKGVTGLQAVNQGIDNRVRYIDELRNSYNSTLSVPPRSNFTSTYNPYDLSNPVRYG